MNGMNQRRCGNGINLFPHFPLATTRVCRLCVESIVFLSHSRSSFSQAGKTKTGDSGSNSDSVRCRHIDSLPFQNVRERERLNMNRPTSERTRSHQTSFARRTERLAAAQFKTSGVNRWNKKTKKQKKKDNFPMTLN